MAMSSPQSASTTPPAMTIPTLLAQRAAAHPDKAFIVDGDTTLSYGNTLERVRALGCWLVQQGCTPGDRVAIWAPNCQQWVIAALGAQMVGATVVTLNTRYKGSEAADILERSGARFLFAVDRFLDIDYPAQLAGFSEG